MGIRWSDRTSASDIAFNDSETSAHKFRVKEIEVFEMADKT
jgi:hypothetical protein